VTSNSRLRYPIPLILDGVNADRTTTIRHDPQRQSREKAQQNRRHRQFIGLSGRKGEANRPAGAVRYDTGFGGEAAA
jgi:hypothetical protein